MSYLEHLQSFKRRELSLMTIAGLPESARLQLAVELLVFVRFEPHYLDEMIRLVKRMLPQLPENDRLWVLKEIDQVIEDSNACLGKKSSEHLDAMLLMALSDEQRFAYARHLVQRLSPQLVLVSEAALWGLAKLCPLMDAYQKRELIPKILQFIQTRTLPDADVVAFLQTVFIKVAAAERHELLKCWTDYLLQNTKDEKFVLLILSALYELDPHFAPLEKNHVLQGLVGLFSHAHRKVVEKMMLLYTRILTSVAPKDKFVHLAVLMQQEAQVEHLETICEVLQEHLQSLECPKQQQNIFRFLQRFEKTGDVRLSGDPV